MSKQSEVVSEQMERLPFAESFQELIVYRKQRELAREVFQLSRAFPNEERFSLTGQVRRASRSIGAQIAEAWAKRRYEKHFISKLTDADGERFETQHWLCAAFDCGYLSTEDTERLMEICREIGRMLASMMDHPEKFCAPSNRIREDSDEPTADSSDH
jgi:four helix bundle protein